MLRSYHYALYPCIGFKSCATGYRYNQELPNSSITFTNYLQTPLEHKEFSNSLPHLDLGLGFSVQSTYLLGLRFGFLVPLDDDRWRINASKAALDDSPGIRYPCYFSLTLGVGGISRHPDFYRRTRRVDTEQRIGWLD